MKKLEFELCRPTDDLSEWLEDDEALEIEAPLPKLLLPRGVTFAVTAFTREKEDYAESAMEEIKCNEDTKDYNEMVRRKIDATLISRLINKFNEVVGTHLIVFDIAYRIEYMSNMQYTLTGPDRDLLLFNAWFYGESWLDVFAPTDRDLAELTSIPTEKLIADFNDAYDGSVMPKWEDLK